MPPRPTLLSRRRFLVAGSATAGAVLLGACGGDDGGTDTDGQAGGASDLALAQFFGGPLFVAGTTIRAPFGVVDTDGLLPVDDTPGELEVQLLGSDGSAVGEPTTVVRHADGLPRAYFPLEIAVAEPGIYTARTSIEGAPAEMSLKVDTAADVAVVQPGAPMPAVATPTLDDARGVDPVCTADPVCPLHDVTLADALGEDRPVALLVATPAFCQIAICGPVLDVLLSVVDDHPDVRFIHAEPFAAPATDLDTPAPVATELGLHFEPCLVLVGADGTVARRLDTIYDRAELTAALSQLA